MIKLLLLDIDGVMTNGKVCIDEHGCESKQIDFQDIDAIFRAKRLGIKIGFISGEKGPIVDYFNRRFTPDHFLSGCKDKRAGIDSVIEKSGFGLNEIAYVGDSLHDYEAIKYAGLGMCPANAVNEVKVAARVVLKHSGGDGAVKEAVEYIINQEYPKTNSVIPEDRGSLFDDIETAIRQHDEMIKSILENVQLKNQLHEAAIMVARALNEGGQVLFCGNGGSAADAQHLSTELVSRFYHERPALSAEALTTNTSALTAIANDYDFDRVFSRQLEARGKRGDVLIGITTSGNSRNVVHALKSARALGIYTVAMTGMHESTEVEQISDITIRIPSCLTPRIQEGHILAGHIICELVEKELLKT